MVTFVNLAVVAAVIVAMLIRRLWLVRHGRIRLGRPHQQFRSQPLREK